MPFDAGLHAERVPVSGSGISPGKRITDIAVASVLLPVAVPVMAILAMILLVLQGRPVFHISCRCTAPGRTFGLIKFRTMTVAQNDSGASGGDKAARITPLGHWLRAHRLDELPQLINVLRGELSLIGPRAPLPEYVDRFPDLYARVLRNRPGLTGLATVVFHRHESRLLSVCRTATDTDAVYARRCIPRKARLDLIYQRRRSVMLDLWILARTLRVVFRPGRGQVTWMQKSVRRMMTVGRMSHRGEAKDDNARSGCYPKQGIRPRTLAREDHRNRPARPADS